MSMSGKQMMALEALLLEELIAERDSLRKRVKDLEKQPKQKPVAVFDEKFGRPKMLANAPILTHGQKFYTTPPQPETPPECVTDAEKKAFAFGWFKAMEAQRLAQPEQKPVAWERHAKKLTDWMYCMSYNDSYFGEPAGLVKQVTSELNRLIVNAPPQREWVGLTDDEREELMDTYDVASTDYARAIEAKLKQKNGYAE